MEKRAPPDENVPPKILETTYQPRLATPGLEGGVVTKHKCTPLEAESDEAQALRRKRRT